MNPRDRAHQPRHLRCTRASSTLRTLVAASLAALAAALATGCGSGISTALPAAAGKTANGVPGGPTIGYIWTSTDQTLRPMLGVVGSGLVGQSIVPAGAYLAGAASSASEIGLVEDEQGGLYTLNLPSPNATPVATGLPTPAQFAFSPLGARAVAFVPGTASLTLISALTTQPTVTTLAAPANLASAIVSDAGTILIATQDKPARIGVLTSAGQFSQLATVAQLGGISFLANRDDALLTDASTNTLARLTSVSKSPGSQSLSSTGVNHPVALASSQDGLWGVVVNGGDQNVVRVDLTGATPNAKLTCSCQPSQINVLSGGKTFRLNDLTAGPVWIADLTASTPQLVFVPALH